MTRRSNDVISVMNCSNAYGGFPTHRTVAVAVVRRVLEHLPAVFAFQQLREPFNVGSTITMSGLRSCIRSISLLHAPLDV